MATNWICNYAVVQVTLPGIANLGWKFWIIWAVICFAFIPITYLFYPETANRYEPLFPLLRRYLMRSIGLLRISIGSSRRALGLSFAATSSLCSCRDRLNSSRRTKGLLTQIWIAMRRDRIASRVSMWRSKRRFETPEDARIAHQ